MLLALACTPATAHEALWGRIAGEENIVVFTRHTNSPMVFVSHRPNIDLLTMELLDEGELSVGKVDADGRVEVVGRTRIREP